MAGKACAVMWVLYRSVVFKRALSQKTKLLISQLIYCPTLICGHEFWVATERTRLWIQATEMSFICRMAGLSLRDGVRSSVIRRGLRVEPLLLHIKRSHLRWVGHLVRIPLRSLPGEMLWACPRKVIDGKMYTGFLRCQYH